jgi:spermidine/putrescine transport system permease protein
MNSRILQGLLLGFVGLVIFGPLIVLAIFSFNDSQVLAFPLKGLTIDWYEQALGNADLREALWNSIKIAVIVTPLCLVLGTLSAVGLTRYVFKGRGPAAALVALPLVLPWLVIGISGLLFFDWVSRNLFQLELSLITAGAMHIVVAFPLVTALVSAQLYRIERNLEEAAMDLGATRRQALRLVILPLLVPTLAASAIFVFSWSFNNFIVSFFTLGFESTFPVWVFSSLRRARNLPVVNAISTLVSVIQVLVVWGAWRVLRWQSEKQGQDFREVLAGGSHV